MLLLYITVINYTVHYIYIFYVGSRNWICFYTPRMISGLAEVLIVLLTSYTSQQPPLCQVVLSCTRKSRKSKGQCDLYSWAFPESGSVDLPLLSLDPSCIFFKIFKHLVWCHVKCSEVLFCSYGIPATGWPALKRHDLPKQQPPSGEAAKLAHGTGWNHLKKVVAHILDIL